MRETKGTSQSKGNIAKGLIKNTNGTVVETDTGIITYSPGSEPRA
jgi:hypothetical protein